MMRYRLEAQKGPVRQRWEALHGELNERTKRLTAAAEARAIGYGGITLVSEVTGLGRPVIRRGLQELAAGESLPAGRVRRSGGGRRRLIDVDPALGEDLDRLVEPVTRGDPMSPLRWTAKSAVALTRELRALGHQVGPTTVTALLKQRGYRLQANRKRLEGAQHPDRDAQFRFIAEHARDWRPAGQPPEV